MPSNVSAEERLCGMDATAVIANVQRFSLHDGPGIRTTVFVKGCNLRCAWCHNPETIAFEPEVLLHPDRCIHCGRCADGCFAGARMVCGVRRTVESVLEEVLLDKPYYGDAGGVTVSGGEPLCRPEFTAALLAACRASGVRTAMESNMAVPWAAIEPALRHCDLLMCDLKLWDSEKHRRWTGAPNGTIRENILKASASGAPVLLRTPVIPGVNDSEPEILPIARFALSLPTLVCYELLPYHPLRSVKGVSQGFAPARRGARMVLMHDRPVLGGNASSEVRMWICGAARGDGGKNYRREKCNGDQMDEL